MATDTFHPISLTSLLQIILRQYDKCNSILGVPRKLFFTPKLIEPFRLERFGQLLETPIGVAAGPHTQLSQNIVVAWLTGARFIELKTVQTLDQIEVSKPCIDMQDEGYNCEWSQELTIKQSFDQYLDAWIAIHILQHRLGVSTNNRFGTIFNMSVGYNYDGILNENVQWFLSKMNDASIEIENKIQSIKTIYPEVENIWINPKISNNVTLSTMHGCPPEEIEKIGHYLINEKKLHTAIKFNPTLLGRDFIHDYFLKSGFETQIPNDAFEHDPTFADAIRIINNLSKTAKENNLHFSVKLTNTLESLNNKEVFDTAQERMYMSGRALHPLSISLAKKIQDEYQGELDISLSGGANSQNVSELVACGLSPVTVCTDLLKPGGYGRLNQYIEELRLMFEGYRATSIDDYIRRRSGYTSNDVSSCLQSNLDRYAQEVLKSKKYKKNTIHAPSIKTNRELGYFDCIFAPCEETCSTNQSVPTYAYHTANCNLSKAGETILQTNPFPNTTGMICDHLCQTKCTRINYEGSVLIREIKRYVAETAIAKEIASPQTPQRNVLNKRVSIIGAGPSGLSCAYFLAMAGLSVNVYESKSKPGGMVSEVIPSFRLTDKALEIDVERIKKLGVKIHFGQEVKGEAFNNIKGNGDYLFVAVGAQKSSKLNIDGADAKGVLDPLDLLKRIKAGERPELGKNIVIIGGGNTAMDVARTVYRIAPTNAKITVLYRRTIKQMPADLGEIKAVISEGIEIKELVSPEEIKTDKGKVIAIKCSLMQLGEKDESGRQRPVKIPDSNFVLEADTIIPAVGQEMEFDFGGNAPLVSTVGSYETQIPNVFMGGDALRGASTAINAIGDGRKVAQLIINKVGIDFETRPHNCRTPLDAPNHIYNRSRRVSAARITELPFDERKNFNLVASTLTEDEIIDEAKRCLLCDEFCSVCSSVCPNLANYTYQTPVTSYQVQKVVNLNNNNVVIENTSHFNIKQPYQIINITDFCNECGNCNTFCPTADAPFLKKPRVYLSKVTFDEVDNGFYFERMDNGTVGIIYKINGLVCSLHEGNQNSVYNYEDANVKAIIRKEDLAIIQCEFNLNGREQFTNLNAIQMSVILSGIKSFFQ